MTDEQTKPKPRTNKTFSLSLTPELRERLAKLAEAKDRSPGYITRQAIIKYLEEQGY